MNNRYKTMLCRHYETDKGCQIGDRCQFAHGVQELRGKEDPIPSQNAYYTHNMCIPGSMSYKTMKCYYFERDKYCKYGNACQFAHSDSELKSADEISYLCSIATAMNSQYTAGYNYQDPYINMTASVYPQTMGMDEYQQITNQNLLKQNNNQYDMSYTPDTNYGDGSSFQDNNPPYNPQYYQQTSINYDYTQLQNYGYIFDPKTNQYVYANDSNYYQQYYDYSGSNLGNTNINTQSNLNSTNNIVTENVGKNKKENFTSESGQNEQTKNDVIKPGKKITIEIENMK